jgi:hypothetical protein
MDTFPRTTKELVRCYMRRQQIDRKPISSMEEIRRQLGWTFCIHPAIKKLSQ